MNRMIRYFFIRHFFIFPLFSDIFRGEKEKAQRVEVRNCEKRLRRNASLPFCERLICGEIRRSERNKLNENERKKYDCNVNRVEFIHIFFLAIPERRVAPRFCGALGTFWYGRATAYARIVRRTHLFTYKWISAHIFSLLFRQFDLEVD